MLRRIESTSTSRGFGYISAMRQSIFQIVRESESHSKKRLCAGFVQFYTRVEPSVTRQKQATMELNFDVFLFFLFFPLRCYIPSNRAHGTSFSMWIKFSLSYIFASSLIVAFAICEATLILDPRALCIAVSANNTQHI